MQIASVNSFVHTSGGADRMAPWPVAGSRRSSQPFLPPGPASSLHEAFRNAIEGLNDLRERHASASRQQQAVPERTGSPPASSDLRSDLIHAAREVVNAVNARLADTPAGNVTQSQRAVNNLTGGIDLELLGISKDVGARLALDEVSLLGGENPTVEMVGERLNELGQLFQRLVDHGYHDGTYTVHGIVAGAGPTGNLVDLRL